MPESQPVCWCGHYPGEHCQQPEDGGGCCGEAIGVTPPAACPCEGYAPVPESNVVVVALDWWHTDGTVRSVAFGSAVTSTPRVLLELTVDPDTDANVLTVTAGNVPAYDLSPAGRLRAVADLLGDLAQLITAAADDTEEKP